MQNNNRSDPAYYVASINAGSWTRIEGTEMQIYANDAAGFDSYPAVVGGVADAVVVAFYTTKKPAVGVAGGIAGERRKGLNVMLPGSTLHLEGSATIDLVTLLHGNLTVVPKWNEMAVNLCFVAV